MPDDGAAAGRAPGDWAGRVALVTGASRGIGAAVARELARRGATVVALARTQGGLEELDDAIRAAGGAGATLLPLDLSDAAATDRIGPSLLARFGRLDVLAHCAGTLGKLTPVPHIAPKDWDRALGVNLSAGWRLVRGCGALLQTAPAGRAVFVTSGAARRHTPYWGLYAATKAAMDTLALTWAAEVAAISPLRVNLFSPGPVATRMRREAFPGEDQATLPTPDQVAPAIADLCAAAETRTGERIRFG